MNPVIACQREGISVEMGHTTSVKAFFITSGTSGDGSEVAETCSSPRSKLVHDMREKGTDILQVRLASEKGEAGC